MAWDKGDITTDITSQIHAKGGPKANKLQAETDNLQEGVAINAKVKSRATANQVLKQKNYPIKIFFFHTRPHLHLHILFL